MLTSEETKTNAEGNVTVGTLDLITPSGKHTYFVGKVGGVIASTSQGYKFYTEEEARRNATTFRQSCRDAVNKS